MPRISKQSKAKEIAEILNISVSTSKSQFYKPRVCLIEKLKKLESYETHFN